METPPQPESGVVCVHQRPSLVTAGPNCANNSRETVHGDTPLFLDARRSYRPTIRLMSTSPGSRRYRDSLHRKYLSRVVGEALLQPLKQVTMHRTPAKATTHSQTHGGSHHTRVPNVSLQNLQQNSGSKLKGLTSTTHGRDDSQSLC